ncbi:NADH-quinone oxidoreductase subunit M [Micropruina sonneratiae]|uniref:NADH-quinone oxidoreductase subunit M n=1 Tax=Micropruina sonneratiae TaxID=2986940 RepID=UPI0022265993|nr:NADH-quinone oxidoreductase subunit M [Micropruina sp. KQZ13P-5]MCW3158103.1 NADH-quinone oxidoreductase subunit M [Micropruina sp. KQZ13P-5]
MTFPWLTVLGLLPLVGALVLALPLRRAARPVGLAFALLTFAVSVAVTVLYLGGTDLAVRQPWIRAFGAYWALGLDGMGLVMVLLTTFLVPVVMIAEWDVAGHGRWDAQGYFAMALALQGTALFTFLADDVLLFYVFFEATLIPMYFLIGGFGGARRRVAAVQFLMFNLIGGFILLASVIGLFATSASLGGTPSYLLADLAALPMPTELGRWLMIGFLIAFVVKAPMVPVHTWLPLAAEQATPGSSTMMVGILDKIATFAMIKFCIGLFPEASAWVAPVMIVLSLVSIIYGAAAAIASTNLLRLVSYTSVSHFGFMVLGIYVFTTQSINGSIFFMVNHGFSTAALFLAVGYLIKRRGSADINDFGGVEKVAPVLAGSVLLAVLSAISLPGMSTFVSEFLVIAGTWSRTPWVAAIAATGIILAATYGLRLYQRTMTGPVTESTQRHITTDLDGREKAVLVPVIGLMLLFGFLPGPVMAVTEPTAQAAMQRMQLTDPVAPAKGEK